MAMDRKKAILDILESYYGFFPRAALEGARGMRKEITPDLLRILRNTLDNSKEYSEDETRIGHLYAMYLLAEFRESKALPLVMEFFSLPDETIDKLTDFGFSQHVHRIQASLIVGGDITPLKNHIEAAGSSPYSRCSCLEAMETLVLAGEIGRDEVMDYLMELMGKIPRKPSLLWDDLVSTASDLWPHEAMDRIRQAFADNLVDLKHIDLPYVEEDLKLGVEGCMRQLEKNAVYSLVDDAISLLKELCLFRDVPEDSPLEEDDYDDYDGYDLPPMETGRNDPCPCGSGKKYKKCCLGRDEPHGIGPSLN